MDFTLGLGNTDPDLSIAVSPAWVHLRQSTIVSYLMLTNPTGSKSRKVGISIRLCQLSGMIEEKVSWSASHAG